MPFLVTLIHFINIDDTFVALILCQLLTDNGINVCKKKKKFEDLPVRNSLISFHLTFIKINVSKRSRV